MQGVRVSIRKLPTHSLVVRAGGGGKSSIAHTLTLWFKDAGRFRSCFCFARDGQAERRKEKLFTTIAHDPADKGPCIPAGFG